jgi:hypothetical protein
MPGTAIIQSGNYLLEIDQGFATNAFTLDDATKGLLDSTTYVLDGTLTFADVTDGALNISVRRGRRDAGDSFSAGTMSFTLNDTLAGGVFNPFDTESPYYDTYQNVPGLAPMRQVRLGRYDDTATLEYLFVGYVVNYDYNFALGGLNTVNVYCADQFYLLAQTYMDELNVTPETSGERIETVLDLPEVDFPTGPTARNISTGTVDLGHDSPYTVPQGTNVLAYLAQINDTAEFGRLFMSREGVLTFQDRIGSTLDPVSVDFDDTNTATPFSNVGITFEADQVVNRVYLQGLNGTSSTDSDTASIATYFIQTESITNSLLHDATQISDAAAYLLDPEPQARYTDVSTQFASLTTAQRDAVAIVDVGDTISISKTFPSGTGTTSLAQYLAVEGVEHNINYSTGHRITFYTSPTTVLYPLILNDAIYGTLDSTNALASTAPTPTPTTVVTDMFFFQATSTNPTDATTRYIGGAPLAQQSTYANATYTAPVAGTITAATFTWVASAAGSSETISMYVRVNDTTDYLIASVGNSNGTKQFVNSALSVALAANDTFSIKLVNPTWVSNPSGVSIGGVLLFEVA